MNRLIISFLIGLVGPASYGQTSVNFHPESQHDSTFIETNSDAVYERPFIVDVNVQSFRTALGGYVEGNTNYFATDGVGDGFSMELRRFNLFVFSTVADRIKFLSEIEFEHGVEEIALETAMLDFEFHHMLNLRGGILLAPIGRFNQNHDSPAWEFIDRPLISTTIIPATLSEVGFGVHGKQPIGTQNVFSYEAYIVNGIGDGVISNEQGRTWLPAGKHEDMFGEDNNGVPNYTGRLAFKNRKIGELGVSYYGGIFNQFTADGLDLDEKRWLHLFAIDVDLDVKNLNISGEWAMVNVEVPKALGQGFGSTQCGFHVDAIYTILKKDFPKWKNMVFNLNFRYEMVDYNVGEFEETGGNIYDHMIAAVPGLSVRFGGNTVLKANYRYHWERDILGNPAARTAGFQFGLASYF